jgi:c-di-GMP-binding flagellar brake protein YcgR
VPAVAEADRPADGDAESGADYRIDDPLQVLHWLRRLHADGVPLSVVSPGGEAVTLRIAAIDGGHGQIGLGTDAAEATLQRLVQADEALAVGYVDQVKLQFELEPLLLVHAGGRCALRARLPRTIWRFQRRGSYRLALPGRRPPQALFRHPSIPDMQVALRIVDLSAGGCALALPRHLPELQTGTRLHGVRIELDAGTAFDLTLRLQHVAAPDGDADARLGCAFADLQAGAQRALQRFIDRTQQQRRVLGS